MENDHLAGYTAGWLIGDGAEAAKGRRSGVSSRRLRPQLGRSGFIWIPTVARPIVRQSRTHATAVVAELAANAVY